MLDAEERIFARKNQKKAKDGPPGFIGQSRAGHPADLVHPPLQTFSNGPSMWAAFSLVIHTYLDSVPDVFFSH
jgi:hypothetical protein